ncbi:hypothetical protein CBOM_03094 [Ceraceosorus bombacis]|uniref:Uncharacterized protein n=1 Tax=Ceraceosorus bombacis TaxID=401625 RepID=A0A0P1BLA9_9BASI|nr:hypothetical protein CBOM_03094 [Ceraceosorus bombacis]
MREATGEAARARIALSATYQEPRKSASTENREIKGHFYEMKRDRPQIRTASSKVQRDNRF